MRELLLFSMIAFFIFPAYAEENKGFSLSNIFKVKKAEKQKFEAQNKPTEPPVELKGKDGPRMPAVPAGEIEKEILVKTAPTPKTIFTASASQKPAPLPPVTVKYNPDIPFSSLIFQNGFQQNLEPAHMSTLEKNIQIIREGHYRGLIRIQSFSDRGHETAMQRAQKVRKKLLDSDIPLTRLEVQALPASQSKNLIHIFLLGDAG